MKASWLGARGRPLASLLEWLVVGGGLQLVVGWLQPRGYVCVYPRQRAVFVVQLDRQYARATLRQPHWCAYRKLHRRSLTHSQLVD
jgi:hypothetical protein